MNLKEKLLNFGQKTGLNKSDIAHELGISKSNFVGESMRSELNGGLLVKFCAIHPEISADWLLRDEGPMFRNGDTNTVNGVNNGHVGSTYGAEKQDAPAPSCDQCALLTAKDQVIEAQRIAIDALRH